MTVALQNKNAPLCPPFHKNADTRPPNATIDGTMAVNWWALHGYFNSAARGEALPDMRACGREYIQKGDHLTLSGNYRTGVVVEWHIRR